MTTIVSLYQAGESLYDLFDKVCVLYEGRLAYYGPRSQARAYFEDMGYSPANRQTTADFLVAVTDPLARIPKSPTELSKAVKRRSSLYRTAPFSVELEEDMRDAGIDIDLRAARDSLQSSNNHTSKRQSIQRRISTRSSKRYSFKSLNDPSSPYSLSPAQASRPLPKTAEDFASYFKASQVGQQNSREVKEYKLKFTPPPGQGQTGMYGSEGSDGMMGRQSKALSAVNAYAYHLRTYTASTHAERPALTRRGPGPGKGTGPAIGGSPYTTSLWTQAKMVGVRRLQMMRGDWAVVGLGIL
jgi:ATP-binding cassette subfamily G (WHITE) protein 2 (SNQ2)